MDDWGKSIIFPMPHFPHWFNADFRTAVSNVSSKFSNSMKYCEGGWLTSGIERTLLNFQAQLLRIYQQECKYTQDGPRRSHSLLSSSVFQTLTEIFGIMLVFFPFALFLWGYSFTIILLDFWKAEKMFGSGSHLNWHLITWFLSSIALQGPDVLPPLPVRDIFT